MSIVITADKKTTDTPIYEMLRLVTTDLPILLLSRSEQLDFNEEVYSLRDREYICVDVIEGGWDNPITETLIVGNNTKDFRFLQWDKWEVLHNFMTENTPKLYFKRELLLKDETETILPIEYVNYQPYYELQDEQEFNQRPIVAMNFWGRSHEARLMLQGAIWKFAAKNGYSVCDNIYQYNDFMHHERSAKKILSFHIPFYSRIPVIELMKIAAFSKFCISLPGCGVKCFRSTGEAINNTICVLPEDELAYSYPLIHNKNCIKFSNEGDITGLKNEWKVMEAIVEALQNPNLYDIYCEGKKVAEWYQVNNYIKNYLEPIINA